MTQRNPSKHDSLAPDPIGAAEGRTLPGLLWQRCLRSPDRPAYHQYDDRSARWVTWSWREIGVEVDRWRRALAGEGLTRGERVAILLAKSVQWICFEQAALGLGLVVVPLYTWDSAENIAYLLRDSGCRLLLTGKADQWADLAPHADRLPDLVRVLCLEEGIAPSPAVPAIVPVADWLPPPEGEPMPPADESDPDDLATIIYTSGTTGPPKGVMLSHANILRNAEAILRVIDCTPTDRLLSFLPLSHAFERTVGYYTPMMAGCSVAYSRSMEQLADDLQAMQPTILISVPRIYEKIYARVHEQLRDKPFLARRLFALALAIGWRRFQWSQGRQPQPPPVHRLLWPLLNRLVAAKITGRLGGRIRFAVSGGAPLLESVSRFFLSLGLPLIQGYGLTEAAPVVSTNTPARNLPASVGPPLPGVEWTLGPDSELLVRSPGLMLGYWQQPERTREVIDEAGWLHTGDAVAMEEGALHIRGRLKEIIVTSTGEKVAPADLEMVITADPLVDHALVVGEGRPYLAALLVLRPDGWRKLAKECGVDPADPSSLETDRVLKAVLSVVGGLLHAFPAHAQVRRAALLLDEWSIANGLLTPTLKLKRTVIEERYALVIAGLYRGHAIPDPASVVDE